MKIGLVGATALAVGGLTAGALPTGRPFYLSPAVRHEFGLPAAGMVCAVAGLVVLVGAWLRLRPALAGQPRRALAVLACWTAPLVLAPPLFSRDVYSYLAQGALVGRGLDAYAVGPAALGGNPLVAQVHPLWLSTPAPYGPVFLGLAAAVVGVTGTHLVAGVLGCGRSRSRRWSPSPMWYRAWPSGTASIRAGRCGSGCSTRSSWYTVSRAGTTICSWSRC